MGILNLFNRKNETSPKTVEKPSTNNAWEQLGGQPFQPQTAEAQQELAKQQAELANRQRHRDKLVNAILYGPQGFHYDYRNVTEDSRNAVYDKIANQEFDDTAASQILQHVALPSQIAKGGIAEVFQDPRVSGLHARRFVARLNGKGFSHPERIGSADMQAFLEEYPTPIEFIEATSDFMIELSESNDYAKCEAYAKDIDAFRAAIYGKRNEYYEAYDLLKNEADRYARTNTARQQFKNIYSSNGITETTASANVTGMISDPNNIITDSQNNPKNYAPVEKDQAYMAPEEYQ